LYVIINLMPNRFINSQGGIVPILVLLAAVGLIGFIVLANSASFKDGLFASLFTKPASHAQQLPLQAEIVVKFRAGTSEQVKQNIRTHFGLTKMTDVTNNGPEKDRIPVEVRETILTLLSKNQAVEGATPTP
jgi:hypothetical protein